MRKQPTVKKQTSNVTTLPVGLSADEIAARKPVVAVAPEYVQQPVIDTARELRLDLSTIDDDEADVAVIVARLNAAMVAIHGLCEQMGTSLETLAAVNRRTRLMRDPDCRAAKVKAAEVLPLGRHPDDLPAVAWVQEQTLKWVSNTPYLKLSRLTDQLNAAGFTTRQGRPYDQRMTAQLARACRKPYQGKWD